VSNQIHRLSHRVEADESSNLVCYGLDRVVERKATAATTTATTTATFSSSYC